MLLGIVAVAAGLKKATGHAYDALDGGQALVLAGGVALFLAADAVFRRMLRIGRGAGAPGAARSLALATIPLGTEVAAVAQVAALAAWSRPAPGADDQPAGGAARRASSTRERTPSLA